MKAAYRQANQHTLMWLTVVLFGLAGQLPVMWLMYSLGWEKKLQAWVLVPAAVPLCLSIIFGRWRFARLNRQRLLGVSATLESLGFMASMEPKPETKTSFWQSMEKVMSYMEMDRGSEAVQWLALRGEEGSRMAAWEYLYTTGGGKTHQVHQFTGLAWPATHPDLPEGLGLLPGCHLRKTGRLQRRAWRKHEATVPGMEALHKIWALYGSVETATRVLTPEMLAVLERSPKFESWFIGDGWVCCRFRSDLDGKNLQLFWDHAHEVLKRLR
ncbi:hypothetical protein [Brevifollis gellanilyticus]|nr:hypothetical protein [Brevifollis gellanilyticus]